MYSQTHRQGQEKGQQADSAVQVTEACEKLLAEDGRVIVEFENEQLPQITEHLEMLDRRRYGIVGIGFYGHAKSRKEQEHA